MRQRTFRNGEIIPPTRLPISSSPKSCRRPLDKSCRVWEEKKDDRRETLDGEGRKRAKSPTCMGSKFLF